MKTTLNTVLAVMVALSLSACSNKNPSGLEKSPCACLGVGVKNG